MGVRGICRHGFCVIVVVRGSGSRSGSCSGSGSRSGTGGVSDSGMGLDVVGSGRGGVVVGGVACLLYVVVGVVLCCS